MHLVKQKYDSRARPQSNSVTLRLNSKTVDSLRELAQRDEASLNFTISEILDKYVAIWTYEESLGYIAMSPDMLRMTFARLKDEDLGEIGLTVGKAVSPQTVSLIYGKFSKETVLKFIDTFLGKRFKLYEHHYEKESRTHTISIVHDINLQFSTYLCHIWTGLLSSVDVNVNQKDITISPSGLTFSFEVD